MRILSIDLDFLTPAFRALGHDVLTVGHSNGHDITITSPCRALALYAKVCDAGFRPDLVFWCDASNLPYLPGIEELPCLTAFYSIDTYCNTWHFSFANAFDAVFVAQKDHIPLFPANELPVIWLPLCASHADAVTLPERFTDRDIPTVFVGTRKHPNNPDREPFLQKFRLAQPLVICSGEYAPLFSRSRIVLNQTACSEVNLRIFEAAAYGAAVLMEYCNHGLHELFTPGEHILPLYRRNNWKEAAAIAASALREPERLAAIAACGREHVLRNHMIGNRATAILETLAPMLREQGQQRRFTSLARRRQLVGTAYAMLSDEVGLRLGPTYTRYYQHLFETTMGARAAG